MLQYRVDPAHHTTMPTLSFCDSLPNLREKKKKRALARTLSFVPGSRFPNGQRQNPFSENAVSSDTSLKSLPPPRLPPIPWPPPPWLSNTQSKTLIPNISLSTPFNSIAAKKKKKTLLSLSYVQIFILLYFRFGLETLIAIQYTDRILKTSLFGSHNFEPFQNFWPIIVLGFW